MYNCAWSLQNVTCLSQFWFIAYIFNPTPDLLFQIRESAYIFFIQKYNISMNIEM
jgi:hypothetical protein